MKSDPLSRARAAVLACFVSISGAAEEAEAPPAGKSSTALATAQVPDWSRGDLEFFLHGSMSTEFVPESVLRAFIRAYPDEFPKRDLSHLGLIPDSEFGWPVGFSRSEVRHLGSLPSVGVNCASCHVGEIEAVAGGARLRVLGMTSHFDAEAFFGSVIVSTFKTADPANMKTFLGAWLAVNDPLEGERLRAEFEEVWKRQEPKIVAAMVADPSGSTGLEPGALHRISDGALSVDPRDLAGADLPGLVRSMLKLFHNMRASLHVPDQPPDKTPPAPAPGATTPSDCSPPSSSEPRSRTRP